MIIRLNLLFLFWMGVLNATAQCEDINKKLNLNKEIFTGSRHELEVLLGGFAVLQPDQTDYIVLIDTKGNLYTFRYQEGTWNEVLVSKTMSLPLNRANILRVFENNKTTLF